MANSQALRFEREGCMNSLREKIDAIFNEYDEGEITPTSCLIRILTEVIFELNLIEG